MNQRQPDSEFGDASAMPCAPEIVPVARMPVRGTKEISEHARNLSQLNVWKGLRAIAVDWTVILVCFALAVHYSHPAVWVFAALVIATRQHALLIVMHDASHYRLLPSRNWNDRISNWLLAWPLFVSTEGYRENHLAHHFHLNTEKDPDWVRKEGKREWEFPKTRLQLLRLLARDFFGGGFFDQLKAIRDLSGQKLRQAKSRSSATERLLYYVLVGFAVVAADVWLPVLLLWFLPAFTVLPVILRIRSIAEHFGVEGGHDLNMSRNMHPTLWERLTIAPHHVGYHLDHHLYPAVPFYNLPQLHRLLQAVPEYARQSHQSKSLFGIDGSSVLNEVTMAAAGTK